MNLVFIANKASHKFEEIENDSHVNVSFYDAQTTNWASYCGVARVSQDKELITKHWNPMYVPHPIFSIQSRQNCNSWRFPHAYIHLSRSPRMTTHHVTPGTDISLRRTAAFFGDLKDGVHKGDVHDPRVAVIEVIVDSVRYWVSTENSVTKIVNLSAATITGRAAAPGELRMINKDEVSDGCVVLSRTKDRADGPGAGNGSAVDDVDDDTTGALSRFRRSKVFRRNTRTSGEVEAASNKLKEARTR